MTSQVRRGLIVLFTVCAVSAGAWIARAADLPAETLKKFVPPLSAQEKELLQSIESDKAAIDGFVATRLFMRQVAVYTAALPKAIKYNPGRHGCPQPPPEVIFKYILSDEEGELLYDIKLECTKKKSGFESKCGQEKLSLSESEIRAAAGTLPEKAVALAKLVPPPSPEEEKLLDKACANPPLEIPKFLATRLYMRQVSKMMAALPIGAKFDPASAPEPGKDVSFGYTLNDETVLLFDIRLAWAKKKAGK